MKVSKELLKGSTTMLVLSMLEKEPMYGYQLIKKLEAASSGVFALKEGTLYPILHALESDGAVEAVWSEAEGRARKTYQITNKGRKLLQEKTGEWQLFQRSLNQVLGEA
ncbi:PadR family transcriptional regulator [Paenibacillus sp. ACRRX]|uniref:PadR family transcriptional regulator n=1 Tax=unclassified Paenibacillus TaxID=185978 RepID=UPI001EF4B3F3|nr:PadR family transcriptional regulator [Paenibacillus sp. UMB4589-SE434]MCG7408123.1 PadR family transcriptional regulator [Paenibacillus sp. ACRRX]MDK8181494.1 PadR family transcriptional regulator [Paenibacillus sp. UMB4589-SE434]